MKKLIILILLTGCGGKDSNQSAPNNTISLSCQQQIDAIRDLPQFIDNEDVEFLEDLTNQNGFVLGNNNDAVSITTNFYYLNQDYIKETETITHKGYFIFADCYTASIQTEYKAYKTENITTDEIIDESFVNLRITNKVIN